MLSLGTQIDQGKLVCPTTRQRLRVEGDTLVCLDGEHTYQVIEGVPILLAETASDVGSAGASQDSAMVREYSRERPPSRALALVDRFVGSFGDFRSVGSRRAFEAVLGRTSAEDLCLSIGGGPQRVHPHLTNLNIGRFANVDVVGTAYRLPYADGSVDCVHCEAVLEHLEFPERAVAEMFRVLRPGGELFAATPFLQGFHGYPDHYQNFTQTGHDRLFIRAGFAVIDSGACVGPTFALTDLTSLYCRHYLPSRLLSRLAQRVVQLAALLVRPLDRLLFRRPSAHLLASSVYARSRKP